LKVLVVAPGICTPYSEGRKRFVLDLIQTLSGQNEVLLLTTTVKGESTKLKTRFHTRVLGHGVFHLLYLIIRLPFTIKEFKPDIICVFPYGTFRNLYGVASKLFMRCVDKIASIFSVFCLTVVYSLDEYGRHQQLRKIVSNLTLSQRPDWDGMVVNLGVNTAHWPEKKSNIDVDSSHKTLLFMAGMWEQTTDRVDHVIAVRGLGVLLEAGESLSSAGIRLIVAAPLFSSELCREYVRQHAKNTWPESNLEFREFVSVPEIYWDADLFVFPYTKEINHFVPTSVVEAMLAGVPVALSDKSFLDPLAGNEDRVVRINAFDHESLSNVLVDTLNNPDLLRRLSGSAACYARESWSIEASAEQIQQLYERRNNTVNR